MLLLVTIKGLKIKKEEKMNRNAIVTIVSNNYFSQALCLLKSIRKIYNDELELFVVIVDEKSDLVDYSESGANVIFAKNLGIDDFKYYAMKYNVIEFNTFVKPFVLEKLLNEFDKVLYMDPDICIFSRLDEIYSFLDNYDMVLTPHKLTNLERPDENEMNIRRAGFFNLGFCGVKNSKMAKEILKCWKNDLLDNCYSDIANHQFTDQKSVANLFYIFYNNIGILKNPGMNFAPWNFDERRIIDENNDLYVTLGESDELHKLVFFHFSGFYVNGGKNYFTTKHQDMLIKSDGLLKTLEEYRINIINNHYNEYSKIKYEYNYFSDGVYISRFERRVFEYLIEKKLINKNDDSFDKNGKFRQLLKRNHLLTKNKIKDVDLASINVLKKGGFSKKEKIVRFLMKLIKRIIGITNYVMLMKYLSYSSRMNNQMFLIKDKKNEKNN